MSDATRTILDGLQIQRISHGKTNYILAELSKLTGRPYLLDKPNQWTL